MGALTLASLRLVFQIFQSPARGVASLVVNEKTLKRRLKMRSIKCLRLLNVKKS